MKKILFVIITGVLTLLAVTQCQGQAVFLEEDLYTTTSTKRFSNAAGTVTGVTYVTSDSLVNIPVKATFTINGRQESLSPDSIIWVWYAKGTTTADSVGLYLTLLTRINGGINLTRTPVDSILANETDYKILTRTWYEGKDYLTVAIKTTNVAAVATKNQCKENGGSTLILRQKRYFKF